MTSDQAHPMITRGTAWMKAWKASSLTRLLGQTRAPWSIEVADHGIRITVNGQASEYAALEVPALHEEHGVIWSRHQFAAERPNQLWLADPTPSTRPRRASSTCALSKRARPSWPPAPGRTTKEP
ncbi:hypothetical protein, partial [Microbacterium sp.]|uniref:hypothetical protein n=1 Tax=Microbacterium sp. TaxID=51671 RepID=UPI003F978F18